MKYNDQLFHKYVDGLKVGDVLFEAAGVQYVKRSDGLWVTGDNVAEDDPIVNVTDYINSLHSIIDAAAEWDADCENEELAKDVMSVLDEIADYRIKGVI